MAEKTEPLNDAVRVLARADRHLVVARRWYGQVSPELADRFLATFEENARGLTTVPLSHPEDTRVGARHVALSPFPYNLWYRVEGTVVSVVAVTHQRRGPTRAADFDPSPWHRRRLAKARDRHRRLGTRGRVGAHRAKRASAALSSRQVLASLDLVKRPDLVKAIAQEAASELGKDWWKK